MALKVKVLGFKEMEAALGELENKTTARNVLKRALIIVGEKHIAEPARSMAPVNTAQLRQGITVSARTKSTAGSKAYAAEMRASGDKALAARSARAANKAAKGEKSFAMAFVGVSGLAAPRAHLQEFGRVGQPAQPFMRPAFDGGKQGAVDDLLGVVQDQLTKAKARAARKALKKARL